MITPINIQVYLWKDIESYLCTHMKIAPEFFRNYQEVIGGSYKDLWHVWLMLNAGECYHGKISTCYFLSLCEEDALEFYGDWIKPFIDAINSLYEEIGKDFIYIYYGCYD